MNIFQRAIRKTTRWAKKEANASQIQAWFRDNGDKTHRLSYDLTPDSVVFDLGGYEGQWASDIFAMYCCLVHVFEPVPEFAEKIRLRFARNPKIQVHDFGLASVTESRNIAVHEDASSLFSEHPNTAIRLVKASDFLAEQQIQSIDLMKINIEGGEYGLLDHLLDTNLILRVNDIQVQFHSFVPDSRAKMENIQARLAKTHNLTYQYEFVWENWHRKPTPGND